MKGGVHDKFCFVNAMSTVSEPHSRSYAPRFPAVVAASLSRAGGNGMSIGDLWSAEAMERISSGVERSFPSDTKNVWPAAFEDCSAVVMQLIKLSIDIKLLLF